MQGACDAGGKREACVAWRAVAQSAWVGGSAAALKALPEIAVDLQEYYRVWLWPVEAQTVSDALGACSRVYVAASALRELAVARPRDDLLRHVVTGLMALAARGCCTLKQRKQTGWAGAVPARTLCWYGVADLSAE